MTDSQQSLDAVVTGTNTSTPAPTGSDLTTIIAGLTAERDDWKNRHSGQQKATALKIEALKAKEEAFDKLNADHEGLKATSLSEKATWEKQSQTWEQEKGELLKKLNGYELADKVRSLVHKDFNELAVDFETDPIYRAGILSAAQTMDDEALKKALTDSLATRQGRQQQVLNNALQGSTSPTPPSGSPAGETAEQILQRMMATPFNSPEYAKLEDLLQKAASKKS